MKKKLKDLTEEEMNNICKNQRIKCTCKNDKLISCPLWCGKCIKGFISNIRFINKEIDL